MPKGHTTIIIVAQPQGHCILVQSGGVH